MRNLVTGGYHMNVKVGKQKKTSGSAKFRHPRLLIIADEILLMNDNELSNLC